MSRLARLEIMGVDRLGQPCRQGPRLLERGSDCPPVSGHAILAHGEFRERGDGPLRRDHRLGVAGGCGQQIEIDAGQTLFCVAAALAGVFPVATPRLQVGQSCRDGVAGSGQPFGTGGLSDPQPMYFVEHLAAGAVERVDVIANPCELLPGVGQFVGGLRDGSLRGVAGGGSCDCLPLGIAEVRFQ